MSDVDTVVFLAGVEWDAVRGTDRHLAEELQETLPVTWVDPPLSVVRALRDGDRARLSRVTAVERVGCNIERVSLLVPPYPTRRGFRGLAGLVMRRALGSYLAERGRRVVGVVGTAPHVSLRLVPVQPGGRHVYYATDDFVAGADLMGLSGATLAAGEASRLREADEVAAITPQILQRWGVQGRNGHVIPNGCSPEHYADVAAVEPAPDVHLPAPIAGLVGQLSPRIDLRYLESIAGTGMSVLLVGPLQPSFEPERVAALLARGNVQWVGEKPFERLPAYLSWVDVGLTPYAMSAFNMASFPLKTLEYLSAGRPVVSTPLPAVRNLQCPWVDVADDPAVFAAAVQAAGAVPRTPEVVAARQKFAGGHAWSKRAEDLLSLMGLG